MVADILSPSTGGGGLSFSSSSTNSSYKLLVEEEKGKYCRLQYTSPKVKDSHTLHTPPHSGECVDVCGLSSHLSLTREVNP